MLFVRRRPAPPWLLMELVLPLIPRRCMNDRRISSSLFRLIFPLLVDIFRRALRVSRLDCLFAGKNTKLENDGTTKNTRIPARIVKRRADRK